MNYSDTRQRFLFDGTDIRGEISTLESSYMQILSRQNYPPAVNQLLGEFLTAASLLSATLKFPARVSIQVLGQGPVTTMMAECYQKTKLRGIVRGDLERISGPQRLRQLLGTATLAITIEPQGGERYQGIVPVDQDSLGACLEGYFNQSEQLATKIKLSANQHRASGILVQQMPRTVEEEKSAADWQHISALLDSLQTDEQLHLTHEEQLYRLFHAESTRLLEAELLQFSCSCSKPRTAKTLATLGRDEMESILEETGSVQITCEFCDELYIFNSKDVEDIFDENKPLH
jgi:molecular chaperone Hsp33